MFTSSGMGCTTWFSSWGLPLCVSRHMCSNFPTLFGCLFLSSGGPLSPPLFSIFCIFAVNKFQNTREYSMHTPTFSCRNLFTFPVHLIAKVVVMITNIININILHCVIFMKSYKQIFPRNHFNMFNTTTKNHVVWVKVDSLYRELRCSYKNLKRTTPNWYRKYIYLEGHGQTPPSLVIMINSNIPYL